MSKNWIEKLPNGYYVSRSKVVVPIMELFSEGYEGSLFIDTVDTDQELELSEQFGLYSLTLVQIIPTDRFAWMPLVAITKGYNEQVIKDLLLN